MIVSEVSVVYCRGPILTNALQPHPCSSRCELLADGSIEKEHRMVHPLSMSVNVQRNLSSWYNGIPDLAVDGEMAAVKVGGLLSLQSRLCFVCVDGCLFCCCSCHCFPFFPFLSCSCSLTICLLRFLLLALPKTFSLCSSVATSSSILSPSIAKDVFSLLFCGHLAV